MTVHGYIVTSSVEISHLFLCTIIKSSLLLFFMLDVDGNNRPARFHPHLLLLWSL